MTKKQFSTPHLNFTISPQVEKSSLRPCFQAAIFIDSHEVYSSGWMPGPMPDEVQGTWQEAAQVVSATTGKLHQAIFTCSFMAEDGTVCEPESAVISEGIIQDS
jgi:hypothetical protein